MATGSAAYFRPADNSLEGIDLGTVLKQAVKKFQFLVCGKTGVGKSSLINSLVGMEVCDVNDPGMSGDFEAGTIEVEETLVNLENILVGIWDSPGLQDGTDNEEKYLETMYNKCKDVDIVLYCMDMTVVRWTPPEIKATKLLTEKFGLDFWKKTILVLTKANTVRVPPQYKGRECVYHENLYRNFTRKFRGQLVEQGVPEEVASSVRTVAAGFCDPNDKKEAERFIYYASDKVKPSKENERSDFLQELWVNCSEVLSGLSRAKFFKMTSKRIKVPDDALSENEKKVMKMLEDSLANEKKLRKQLEEKDIGAYEKYQTDIATLRQQLAEARKPSPAYVSQPVYVQPPQRDRLTGAAVGAAYGSMFGPAGAVVGAAIGFLFS